MGAYSRFIGSLMSYPRIVGETGGKDFIVAHPNCDHRGLIVALLRGSFEFQGQNVVLLAVHIFHVLGILRENL